MYRIVLRKTVTKFFDKHPKQRKQFFDILPVLKNDPLDDSLDIKKLSGYEHHYRLRLGKRRFLFTVHAEEVLVYFYDAGSRGDIYK